MNVKILALATALALSPQPSHLQNLLSNLLAPFSSTSLCQKPCKGDNALYSLVRRFEGYSPYTYLDSAGYPTIAFGHMLQKGERFAEPITASQAQTLLESDLKQAENGVNNSVRVNIKQNQFNSLTSFAYNTGTSTLKKSTLLKKVNAGEHEEVPAQFLRYIYAGGKPVNGLLIRRKAEANLYVRQ